MSDFRDLPPSEPPRGNKNLLWILLIILIPIGAVMCCCGAGGWLVYNGVSQIASSESYTNAVKRAKNDPRVKDLLGEPIQESFPTNSNYRSHNGVAEMTLQIPLTGPKGSGKLDVEAGNHAGTWDFSKLDFRSAGGQVINLLTDPEKGIDPPERKLADPAEKPAP